MHYQSIADFGHRLIVEPRGTALQSDERDVLTELQPMAFLFRARNFDFQIPYDEWLAKFTSLIKEIKACVGHEKLLLSIDHEGGRVVRPPLPITRFPYAEQWGERVVEVATAMAVELKSLGINTSWAPVADVLTNKESKAIGQRAFSSDSSIVVQKAVLMAQTLAAHGIAPGAKHFPGHGPVSEDTHHDLPIATISREEWDRVHLPPFAELIKNGIPFLMTAHIMYSHLDSQNQATLSRPILGDILRDKLGFKGVVVADALGMGAIRDQIESSEAVNKALLAELDLFCIAGDSVDLNTARTIADQMLRSVTTGHVGEHILERSRERVLSAIDSLPQHTPEKLSPNIFTQHAALAHELDPNNEWTNFQYIPKGFD